ncbi:hypothetical protein Clacol_005962 [Clathrus columnatus]|uniref:Thiol methyltransferase 1 n=1 Tax=Clathrus columnatus TaxID=1419009 RepID=A0AAV5AGA6_9AGAM|nr:hypothetical protein Clacol_005962 [Clathrus columnatus]
MATVRQLIHENSEKGWEKAWDMNVTPWDVLGSVQPPLRSLLLGTEQDWPRNGRALVPGCGRGYDPIFIATTLNLNTVAVDISPTAIQAAKELLTKTPGIPVGKVIFQETDFFSFSVPENERFILIYDYTFFVAIPPVKRSDWGRQMNSLIKPGGYLIALVYPLTATDDGPPFSVQPEHYHEALGDGWTTVIARTPEDSISSHIGREYLIVWQKE